MARCANLAFTAFEQRRSVSRMGRVTVQTRIAVMQGQMVTWLQHLFLYVLMTLQAGCHAGAGRFAVTLRTAHCIWLMEIIAHQSGSLAAMGVVA